MSVRLKDTIYDLINNSDKLDGKHAADFATSGHTHYSLSTPGDQRSVTTTPNTYSNKFIFQGLKTNSTFGKPSTDTYSYVMGLRGWSDSSGGNSWEIAFNNSGINVRNGATDTWSNWFNVLTSNNSEVSLSGSTLTVKINGVTKSLTNTNTTYSAGSGLSLSGTTFNHAATVTAGTAGTSSATSGSTLAVPYVTYNATGHITATGTHTHTITGFAASSHTHSQYLPKLRMENPDPGHASIGALPFILSLKAAGTPLYGDPEFGSGNNSVNVYNNASNGAVTITRIADNQYSANSSGYILQISTSATTATPGRGGFVQNMTSRAGAIFCQIFRAKIPTGYTLANAENSMGSSYKTHWLTSKAGTGKWEWYCRVTFCGTSGTFSSGGHVYLNADAGGTAAVTWYLSYCNTIDLTKANYDGLRSIYSDKLGTNAGSATNPVYFSGGKPVACTYSLNKTVPSDAKFTDTTYSAGSGLSLSGTTFNHAATVTAGTAGTSSATSGSTLAVPYVTYNATGHVTGYGTHTHTINKIKDIGNSTDTSFAYSKAGLNYADYTWLAGWNGYELRAVNKSQFAQASHTHLYAGSSSAGGAATSANKLNTNAGSDTNPVYFSGGIPVACGSLDLRKHYIIDASTLSTSNFYPVTFASSDIMTECEIHSPNLGGAQPYNQNMIHFQLIAQGWSDTPKSFKILHHGVYSTSEITIGAIGSGNEGGMQCVWVRGGMVYRFYCNKKPTLRTANTSNGNEVFTVGTGYSGGTNTKVTIHWSYGQTSQIVCTAGHTHNYAAASHTHTKSQITDFAHTHNYAASNHNHDSVYSKLGHTHSYAAASHTHNYAGSSSAGGAATSANKLNTNAGSATKPVYFSGGVPVAVTAPMVQYWAIYEVFFGSGGTSSSFVKKAGNHNFYSSVNSHEGVGNIIVNISYPTGFTEATTFIFGNGDHRESNHAQPIYLTVNKLHSYLRLTLADDATNNWGYAYLYFLCIG